MSPPPEKIEQNPVWHTLRVYGIITFFAIAGSIAREGLVDLTTFPTAYCGGLIWSTFTGCSFMGFFVWERRLYTGVLETPGALYASQNAVPLYAGLTSGFCGALTSFSSWMEDLIMYSANLWGDAGGESLPNGGYGIMNFLGVFILEFVTAFGSFAFGRHLATLLNEWEGPLPRWIMLSPRNCHKVEAVVALTGGAAWITLLVLSVTLRNRLWPLYGVFAPFGGILRFVLSRVNARKPAFPPGTFCANMVATTLLAVMLILQRGKSARGGSLLPNMLTCQVLEGLMIGFCGSLSTISTFINELWNLPVKSAYIYGGVTVSLGYILMVLIFGVTAWKNGVSDGNC